MFKHSHPLHLVVFLLGLAAVGWVGVGYLGANPLGALVAAVIAACYLAGAFELVRYRQATATLQQALADVAQARDGLGDWLARLHPSLRNPVRLRVDGARVSLPGPALTPYLVGLLVLLGMLGTLLGMMATLRGTGLALESASDLQAIRGSLAAPVKGLGFAFGTSIAGVAASAMLGLLAALCRRERQQAVQRLDAEIATTLHAHSHASRRDEALALQREQAGLLPQLVAQLQAMTQAIEQQQLAANAQLAARQDDFHARTEAVYARLADSVEASLQAGVAASARSIGEALGPVVDATMAGLARDAAALQQRIEQAVQRQLDGVAASVAGASDAAATRWDAALAAQRDANQALLQDLHASLQRFGDTQDQRALALVETLSERLQASSDGIAAGWRDALAQQAAGHAQLADHHQQALGAATQALEVQASGLAGALQQSQLALRDALQAHDQARLAAWDAAFAGVQQAHAEQREALDAQDRLRRDGWQQQLDAMQRTHAALQDTLEARDQARLGAWTDAFAALSSELNRNWHDTGERVVARQQQICETLAETARAITEQAELHAGQTIAEIAQLVQVASEAPKAAADVVAELRQKLSDSMVRDTAMLEERTRLLATLETLLDAVNHASTEQRAAVDALVGGSAALLERVGTRFTEHVEAETGKLGAVAAELTGSAVEVASLGDAFAAAVGAFGQSNAELMERLQQVAGALDATQARSDEQLAYYVAQAREVVELSVLSQQQIIAELQQRGIAGAGAA